MREAILGQIDAQQSLSFKGSKGSAYAWFHAVSTYGLLRADIEPLWSTWWAVETPGRALAAAQYASCLIYDETANPVFDAWTREHGGGPPCLWHYRGHVLEERWRDTNLEMLERTLTPEGVRDLLDRAVARLTRPPAARQGRRRSAPHGRAHRDAGEALRRRAPLPRHAQRGGVQLQLEHVTAGAGQARRRRGQSA